MVFRKKKRTMKRKRVVRGVNRLLPHDKSKAEKKYFDLTASQTCDTTGAISLINGIGQNTTNNSRIGNRINIKSVEVDARVQSGVIVTDSIYRFMVVYDKEANGTLPLVVGASTSDSILDSASGTAVQAKLNVNNADRYVVISDKVYHQKHDYAFNGIGIVGVPTEDQNSMFRKINTYTQYNAPGAAIAQINAGALYFICMSSIASGTSAPSCLFASRIRYTDE